MSTQVFGGVRLNASHARAVRESGFGAAEIYGAPPHFDLTDEDRVAEAAVFFAEEGVKVTAVHAPYKAHDPCRGRARRLTPTAAEPDMIGITMEYVMAGVRAARRFGAPAVILHCGAYGDKMTGAVVSNFASFFTMLEERLAGSDVKIALENVATPVSDPVYLSYFLEKYELKHFGICLDVAHANIGGDPAAAAGCCGDRLLQVHVSDNNGKEDKHAIPFEGEIDWAAVIRALRAAGYEGCLNFEPRGPAPPEVMLEKCRAVYDRLMELS